MRLEVWPERYLADSISVPGPFDLSTAFREPDQPLYATRINPSQGLFADIPVGEGCSEGLAGLAANTVSTMRKSPYAVAPAQAGAQCVDVLEM
ncbi:hypothetical protein DNJ95_05840 [Stutzerimonas kirkiae]|uniref:Uncharacterized protein n=1 Tax=Stutzerimonas kirkiae TaxID=2211392 RepID=A0A4Q9RBW2_9GAMM|nr:hypothetical protein DNJ96_04570 [Stutzerimonas kirkiae]TBV04306.1 hypothetical protein DNJ95_05840 [Stutzerimonas kirkiae]